jgi:glyoxylase-like metal-dependent hydrolase (beta-lactamase superfamily II)
VPGGSALYLFESGTLGLGGVEVPVPFFLIRHPQGDVLVDGGNPLAVARDPHGHWGALADQFEVHMTARQHCISQLRRLGVGPESVGQMLQTHLHIDHTGALGHFPNATIVVHARELEAARTSDAPHACGDVREDYDRSERRWQLAGGELDLFGDGAIRLLETPGHSAGHMSLLLELDQTGPVLPDDGRAPKRSLPRAKR